MRRDVFTALLMSFFLGQGCAVVANRHRAGEGELKWEFMSSWKVILAGGKME